MSDSLYTIKEPYARYSLTDEAYEKIRVYLPEEKATGRPGMDVTRNLGHGNPKKFFREYICA